MNDLFDYLQKQIGKNDCPIVSIHPVFGIKENYIELIMKDESTIKITEQQHQKWERQHQKWTSVKPTTGFDHNNQPIIIDSWDNKVNRSINNDL